MYIEITDFEPSALDTFLHKTYEENDTVIFVLYFSKVPIHRLRKLIPILEKYRTVTRRKLKKTIVHLDSKWEMWAASKISKIIKPEKPVEFVLSTSPP